MSKMLKKNSLFGQRSLLAVSLAASIAAYGCTTDRSLGNGDLNDRSGVRTAPTSGVTSGSETAPTPPPPMTSSYTYPEVLPTVTAKATPKTTQATRGIRRLSPDEAAAVMAQHRPLVRVLGEVSPALSGNAYHSAGLVTGQWQNPALITNPQQTVNSSISSSPTSVIASGAGAGNVAATTGAINAGVTNGNTANLVQGQTVSDDAIPLFIAGATRGAPSAVSTITPTLGVAARSLTPSIGATNANAVSTGTRLNAVTSTRGLRTTPVSATAVGAGTATVRNPVRVINSSNGTVTVTNQ